MSNTLLKGVGAYLQPSLVKELDHIRGDIPRSRILEKAIRHYIEDVKENKISVLPGANLPGSHQAAAPQRTTLESDTETVSR